MVVYNEVHGVVHSMDEMHALDAQPGDLAVLREGGTLSRWVRVGERRDSWQVLLVPEQDFPHCRTCRCPPGYGFGPPSSATASA